MPMYRARPGFFEVPHAAVYALMTVTVLVSGFCFVQSGAPSAPAELLFRYGDPQLEGEGQMLGRAGAP